MTEIKNITVVGSGQMGAGIALVSAIYGYNVTMNDITQEFIDSGMNKNLKWLDKRVTKGKMSQEEVNAIKARLHGELSLEQAVNSADLVIEAIIEDLKKEKLLGKISFGCMVRSNLVDEELASLLNKMNFQRTSMGLESASPQILEYLKGESISVDNHLSAIKMFKKYDIEPSASFIIGSPKETRTDVLKTLNFIRRSWLKDFNVYVLTPLPGTPVWKYAKKRGLVDNKMDWSRLDVDFAQNYKRAIILSEKLSRGELYRLFLRFRLEKKRRLVVYALNHPLKIPKYLLGLLWAKRPAMIPLR